MGQKKKELSASSSGERTLTFQRARWKHWVRYFGVFVMFFLNISLVLATIEIHTRPTSIDIWRELLSYVIVAFFDLTVFLPTFFEVDKLEATQDKLIVSTLFWKSKIPWKEIRAFHNWVWFTFAVLKTPRCFYLINKRDVKPIDELLETIAHKRARAEA